MGSVLRASDIHAIVPVCFGHPKNTALVSKGRVLISTTSKIQVYPVARCPGKHQIRRDGQERYHPAGS